jgi:hypothetical protein
MWVWRRGSVCGCGCMCRRLAGWRGGPTPLGAERCGVRCVPQPVVLTGISLCDACYCHESLRAQRTRVGPAAHPALSAALASALGPERVVVPTRLAIASPCVEPSRHGAPICNTNRLRGCPPPVQRGRVADLLAAAVATIGRRACCREQVRPPPPIMAEDVAGGHGDDSEPGVSLFVIGPC